jgi:hypothetical protein
MTSRTWRIVESPFTSGPNKIGTNPQCRPPYEAFGKFLAVLRDHKRLSRKQLISRLLNEIDEDDPFFPRISESLLKRVETGQVVKLNRRMVEVFMRALNCTSEERFQLLVLADLNPFADSQGGMSSADIMLANAFFVLKNQVRVGYLTHRAVNDSDPRKFTEAQLLQLLCEIVSHIK